MSAWPTPTSMAKAWISGSITFGLRQPFLLSLLESDSSSRCIYYMSLLCRRHSRSGAHFGELQALSLWAAAVASSGQPCWCSRPQLLSSSASASSPSSVLAGDWYSYQNTQRCCCCPPWSTRNGRGVRVKLRHRSSCWQPNFRTGSVLYQ